MVGDRAGKPSGAVGFCENANREQLLARRKKKREKIENAQKKLNHDCPIVFLAPKNTIGSQNLMHCARCRGTAMRAMQNAIVTKNRGRRNGIRGNLRSKENARVKKRLAAYNSSCTHGWVHGWVQLELYLWRVNVTLTLQDFCKVQFWCISARCTENQSPGEGNPPRFERVHDAFERASKGFVV